MKLKNKNIKKICPLCDRVIPINAPQSVHHLIPKSKGGKGGSTVLLHHICHKQIHLMFKEKELAKSLNRIEDLKNNPKLQKFITWIKKRPPEFLSRTYKLNKNKILQVLVIFTIFFSFEGKKQFLTYMTL